MLRNTQNLKKFPHGFDKSADLLSKRQNHEEDFFFEIKTKSADVFIIIIILKEIRITKLCGLYFSGQNFKIRPIGCTKERSSERVDYDQFLPRNGLFGSIQRFLKH